MKNLLLILGDQLSRSLSSFAASSREDTVVLMAEVQEEAAHAAHHKKKIAFIFSAMRHFAGELQADGWRVDYVKLDDPGNSGSFTGEVKRALARRRPERVVLTEPGEWRVAEMVRGWEAAFGVPVRILPDSRFLAGHDEFERWAAGAGLRAKISCEWSFSTARCAARWACLWMAASRKAAAGTSTPRTANPQAAGCACPRF